jgi:two-component system, response regulator PdtaR
MAGAPEAADRLFVVVVAEDEMLLRMVANDRLTEAGFVAIDAPQASVALEICEAQPEAIDVLFTDVRMPGLMDGLELARCVSERWPWIAVVITSGDVSVSREDLPLGARFVRKPYDVARIVEMIRSMTVEHAASARRNSPSK